MSHSFIAFDLGAESGRALVGHLSNGKLTLEEKHRFANPNGRMNGRLQWNLAGQWEELKVGLRKASAGGVKIDGIGVDTWGVDFGLLAETGEILGNPCHYRDSRTDGMLELAIEKVGRKTIFEATGIQFMQINTLYHLLAMSQSSSVLLKNAQTLLFMPDLFNFLFTGQKRCEATIASTSQMVDPRTGKWATELLTKLGIPTHLLTPLVSPGTVVGPVQADVQQECGCGPIPVIATAGHDTASAVAAVPAQGDDWCYISSGTWSLMGVESRQPIINDKSLQYNYTNEGGVGGTIRFLKNIMGLWLVQECRRQWLKEEHEHSYAELTAMADKAKPFASLIDPNYKPFGVPGDMPNKIVAFCESTRQRVPQSRGEFVRCCLESLALTYRRTIEGLEDMLGRKIAVIHIVGGGTQNELLSQMAADACGRPVVAGPIEATAIGNILVQAMGLGVVKNLEEARSIVRSSFPVKRYEPKGKAKWDEAYARYCKVLVKE